jgi:hypothetical protein
MSFSGGSGYLWKSGNAISSGTLNSQCRPVYFFTSTEYKRGDRNTLRNRSGHAPEEMYTDGSRSLAEKEQEYLAMLSAGKKMRKDQGEYFPKYSMLSYLDKS